MTSLCVSTTLLTWTDSGNFVKQFARPTSRSSTNDRHSRPKDEMLAIDRPAAPATAVSRSPRRTLTRSALITALFIVPAVAVRIVGLHLDPVAALFIFGAAVVAASFLLAWAAEAAQIDVSG